MNPFVDRFTPILATDGGCQQEALSGTARLGVLFDVPFNANSAWLQADADIQFRMDGDPAGSAALTLTKLTFLPLANRAMLDRLILTGSATIAVQFGEGDVGPIPSAPIVADGGGGPPIPGTGTVTSINVAGGDTGLVPTGGPVTSAGVITLTGRARVDTAKVVHVMTSGNDSTGLPYRLDKPFVTLAAAVAASAPYDTIKVWPGLYPSTEVGIPHDLHVDLLNAVLAGDGVYVLSTQGANLRVSGSGEVRHTGNKWALYAPGGSVNSDGVQYSTATSGMAIHAESVTMCRINGDMVGGLRVYSAQLVQVQAAIHANEALLIEGAQRLICAGYVVSPGGAGNAVTVGDCVSADLRMSVEAQAGAVRIVGTSHALIVGDLSSTLSHALKIENSDVTIYGNCTSTGGNGAANGVWLTSGKCSVYGNCAAVAALPAKTDGGHLILHGDAHSERRWGVGTINGGRIDMYGTASCDQRAAVYVGPGGEVHLHGRAVAPNALEGAVLLTPTGALTLYGGAYLDTQSTYNMNVEGGVAATVRNYGAAANKPTRPAVTVVGAPILIVP